MYIFIDKRRLNGKIASHPIYFKGDTKLRKYMFKLKYIYI